MDEYRTEREFYQRFPSRFYICTNCGYMNASPYNCQRCGWRADGLLKTMDKGYKYAIVKTGEIKEIFKPIEVFRKSDEAVPQTRKSKEHE